MIGRQPIYGPDRRIAAYEILYRSSQENAASFQDPDAATARVLLSTFTEFGIERVVGPHLAFVNFTRPFLTGEYAIPAAPSKVVVEVLENILPDAEVLDGLRRLRAAGFRIALDDFEWRDELRPLVELAHIVKLDCLALDARKLEQHVELLRPFGVETLAEKVEDEEQMLLCRDLGFDFFQGYHLCRPRMMSLKVVPPQRVTLLQVVSKLHDPDSDLDELQEILSRDVALCYRVLRYINSCAFGLVREIDSIREAALYLGRDQLRNMCTLMLLASEAADAGDLFSIVLLRARMCELLMRETNRGNASRAFTAGLFSGLDAMLRVPMEAVLADMPLGQELKDALVQRSGELGRLLDCVQHYERGEWDEVAWGALTPEQIGEIYLSAIAWAWEVGASANARAPAAPRRKLG